MTIKKIKNGPRDFGRRVPDEPRAVILNRSRGPSSDPGLLLLLRAAGGGGGSGGEGQTKMSKILAERFANILAGIFANN